MRSAHVQIILVTLVAGLASCSTGRQRSSGGISFPDAIAGHAVVDATQQQRSTAPQFGGIRKRVKGKEEPATLVAVDKSSCAVTAGKFKDTKVGDTVICDWGAGDRAP
jgi:hypothetical protein